MPSEWPSVRCYVPPAAWEAETVTLEREPSHHLARVLRKGPGDRVLLFNGCGGTATGEITDLQRHAVTVRMGERQTHAAPTPHVTLVQALIRSQPMDWLIRKATELGVNTIQPVLTERCVARTRERPERWQRTVVSAAEQCGAVWMPEIRPVRTWTEWCATLPAAEHRVIGALLDSPPPLRHVLRNWQAPRRIEVWIGPEGDFTAAEMEAALAGGVEPASFGPLVMRVETAALFALAAIRYEWGGSPAGSVDLPAAEGYI